MNLIKSRRLVCIHIEATGGAHVVLVKPGFDALDMEVMLACKEEDLVALGVGFQADGADTRWVFLDYCLDRDGTKDFVPHTVLLFQLLSHVLVIELLEDLNVHAVNRGALLGWIVVEGLVLEDSLPFVIPVYEV